MRTLLKNLLFIVLITVTASTSYSQKSNCPRGAVDCKGLCGWYIDTDHDGFCDYTLWSQGQIKKRQRCQDSLAALERVASEQKKKDSLAKAKTSTAKATDNAQNNANPKQNLPASGSQEVSQQTVAPDQPVINPAPVQSGPTPPSKSKYDLILILFACSLLYTFTFLLARRDVIKKATHRKIWNSVLLITFLVSGLLGLFLAIQLNYNFKLDWFASLLYWHVEFGIAMAVISIFHLLWHLKYWLNLFNQPGRSRIKNGE